MKKRVLLTVTKEPYERLQKNIKEVGLPNYWFGREIDKVIFGLNIVIDKILEARSMGRKMTDQQILDAILRTSESVQKMKIKSIEFEEPEE